MMISLLLMMTSIFLSGGRIILASPLLDIMGQKGVLRCRREEAQVLMMLLLEEVLLKVQARVLPKVLVKAQ